MPVFIKVILGAIAAVVLSIAGIALAATWLIDPNDYRDEIASQVEASTGRQFDIDGDLSLSVFPWIAVEVNQSRLADDPAFSEQAMAEIEQLSIRLQLLPLLKREIQVGRILIDGLALQLAVNEEGVSNWDSLLAESTSEEAELAAPEEETTDDSKLPVTSIRIEGLTISDARVSYRDQQSGAQYQLEPFNLETDEVSLDRPFAFTGSARVKASEPDLAVDLDWQGEIELDLDQSQYQLSGFVLNANVETEALEKALPLQLLAELAIDLEQESLTLSSLTLSSDDLSLQGSASLANWSDKGDIALDLTLPSWDAKSWLQDLGVQLPEMSDPDALREVSAKLAAAGSLEQLTVKPLIIELDGSKVEGQASVDLSQERPFVDFSANIDALNVDRYLAASEEEAVDSDEDEPQSTSDADINDTEVDVSALNSLNANADVSIGRLQANRVVTENVDLKLRLNNGTLHLAPLSLNLYSGSLRMEATVSDSDQGANIQFSNRLSALQLGPLTEALMEKPTLSGLGNVSMDLNTRGTTVGQLRQALNGTLSLDLADGIVYGFNVAKMLRSAQARRSGDATALEAAQQEQQTDFAALSATAVIEQGVLSNRDLSLMSPALRLSGDGLVNLFKETIDYRSVVAVVETAKGQAGESLEELKGLKVPIVISGSFSDPSVRVDIAGALKAAAEAKYGEKVKAEKEEAKAKVEEKKQELRDKAREKLNRFFSQ